VLTTAAFFGLIGNPQARGDYRPRCGALSRRMACILREASMNIMLWKSASIDALLYCVTAMIAHFLMSLGQTLFHRYLGHRHLGGKFFTNHVQFHHANYLNDLVVSNQYLSKEGNNTPFFLIPVTLVVGLSYLFLRLDLFMVQLAAMSLSFYGHVYFDKQYHVAGSWLGRFSWFRRKQQLHFIHHRHANCNFAVIDYFWDRLLGTYRSVEARRPGP
jgi:sterol desaturase/sphingolipid hydroxylase (fatty acid hydroxylase superfamily)